VTAISAAIAAAVEEQAAVAREMSGIMQAMTNAVAGIDRSIGLIAASPRVVDEATQHVREISHGLVA
jgi:methyl-accepting chemotaxis protein